MLSVGDKVSLSTYISHMLIEFTTTNNVYNSRLTVTIGDTTGHFALDNNGQVTVLSSLSQTTSVDLADDLEENELLNGIYN